MKLRKTIEIVYVDLKYLEYLHNIDSEVHFENTEEYKKKPHVGVLIAANNFEYVIPLTSAKEKHRNWKDSDSGYYRIYEIIDTRDYTPRKNDILVDIVNHDILNKISENERKFFKQKILSVLDMRKMIPVKPGVYTMVPMQYNLNMSYEERNRISLLMKEWSFLLGIKSKIEEKCDKLYTNQLKKNKVLKFHCNYKLLETACSRYQQ